MKALLSLVSAHFELVAYAWFWLTASGLAVLAGRPWLGLVGLATVLLFVIAYVARARANVGA